MAESTQHKLDRVRAPRVQITYDVEIGDSIENKELPFVVGVVADLVGNPNDETKPAKLKERSFTNIDRDNFEQVMEGMKPRLAYRAQNKLSDENTQLGVELRFNSMEDFEPQNVAKQVEPLRKLLDVRRKLSELLAKMDGNDNLIESLDAIIHDTEKLTALKSD